MSTISPPAPRTAWVDVCKGVAIALVVIHHLVLAMDAHGLLPDAVTYANSGLNSFRMPLLLLASGIFAARTLALSWRTVLHKRVALFAYLYVLWAVIYTAFSLLVPDVRAEVEPGPGLLLSWLVAPNNGLWFFYGLAVFMVVTKLARRVPVWLQLVLAGGLSVVAARGTLDGSGFAWADMAQFYVFFLVGVVASDLVRTTASRASAVSTLVLGTSALGVWGLKAALDLHAFPAVALIESGLAVAAVVSACVWADRRGHLAGLSWLGARTLPIYLLHALWIQLFTSPLLIDDPRSSPPAAVAVLFAGAVAVVVLSLVTHHLLVRAGGAWLFGLPRRWAWSGSDQTPSTSHASVPQQRRVRSTTGSRP